METILGLISDESATGIMIGVALTLFVLDKIIYWVRLLFVQAKAKQVGLDTTKLPLQINTLEIQMEYVMKGLDEQISTNRQEHQEFMRHLEKMYNRIDNLTQTKMDKADCINLKSAGGKG